MHRFVILGGGMVAGYAAKELVEKGLAPGELAIVSLDDSLPYERPPLSKGLLAGREQPSDILINDDAFYREHGISVLLGTRVTRVDFDTRCLHLEGGEQVKYERLLIATGASPLTLDAPGAQLEGVYHLRTIEDSMSIREATARAKRAVAIGGGFIGMEVASVLASQGVETTMVFPAPRVWEKFFTPEISAFFERYYRERNVTIESNQRVTSIEGDQRVEAVMTSGGTRIDADIVVAGIGIEPNVSLFEGTALRTNSGLYVNEYLETNLPDVYAAGDVVRYRDLLFGKLRRADHWDNAVEQGKHVAGILMGDRQPFVHVPYFFSDVFDLSYEYWGDSSTATSVIYRGEVESGSFSAWWQRHETVIAAFVINRPDEERELAPRWIAERQDISTVALSAEPSLGAIPLK